MGLDVTHDCWHGSYGTFMEWRRALTNAAGLPPLEAIWQAKMNDPTDPLFILLNHSDCDGMIAAKDCAPLARRLQELLPKMPKEDFRWSMHTRTELFIAGLYRADEANENVEFQ